MRVLILGGTAFLGKHLTTALRERGHSVTHFNRGRTGAPPEGVRPVHGDRTVGFAGLESERFDAIIDTSGYLPHVVERATRFFASLTDRYVFISSISVYDLSIAELFEDSPMPVLPEGVSRTEMSPETYGPLKAMCERIVAGEFRQRATIVRPGLIVGPNDRTDRFTYWPVRFDRGGDILAPGTPDRQVQFVDVRDLSEFSVRLVERDASGDYNVTSPQGTFTMGDVIGTSADVAGVPSTVHWKDDAFLTEHEIAPWIGLPLWVPPSEGIPGLMNANVGKALAAGLTIRPLKETVRDTLLWAKTRLGDYVPQAGITPERESTVLSAVRSG